MKCKCLFFVCGKQEILMSGKAFVYVKHQIFLKTEECTERKGIVWCYQIAPYKTSASKRPTIKSEKVISSLFHLVFRAALPHFRKMKFLHAFLLLTLLAGILAVSLAESMPAEEEAFSELSREER
ncbi:hypothetical protein CEXT_669821 [Caerostris extrusa]|uniref:Uncharacterized protein n=1 Tax=Caerostris extrusa TaxID=172846 RepID=A0AAV4PFF6_CAEEX|nr:hypothetical protein CEXT_669821 [Caerostris extrusa]